MIEWIEKFPGNVRKELKEFDIPKSTYYDWRRRYRLEGKEGLERKRPVAISHPNSITKETEEKILELRKSYQLGPARITWYLERYYGIKTSQSTVTRTLVRNGVSRLPKTASRRTLHTKRYVKSTPGHHVQIDVKFAFFKDESGKTIKRYQKHNQESAINFIDFVLDKFPFRIHTVRTDRGHEFQAKFHWHVEDKGIRHAYIKPRSPQLNGKVERSHRTDQEEFYQLLKYTDDVDLNVKLAKWEEFYNFNRPHGAHDGRTPFEELRCLLK